MRAKAHVAAALRWSKDAELGFAEAIVSGIGMAGPVLLGASLGHLPLGLAAGLGSLAVGDVRAGGGAKAHAGRLARAFAPGAVGALLAALIAAHGWLTSASLVLIATTAGTIGGYSRGMAVAAIRLVLFLTIAIPVAGGTPHRAGLVLLVLAGALNTSVASLVAGALLRSEPEPEAVDAAGLGPTARQRYRRWKRSLASAAGWQYPARLGACLAVAGILERLWPDRHLHWIALTVAILTQRRCEAFPVKTTQRAIGTALGVLAAGAFVAYRPPAWGVVAGMGLLAGVRPLLRERNYLAYSAVMTPLIILILSAGRPVDGGVLLDRLVATLVGAALVILANAVANREMPATENPRVGGRGAASG